VFQSLQPTLIDGVGGVLVVLSITSWVVILYKAWWLRRVAQDLPLGQAALWQSVHPEQAFSALRLIDRQSVLLPLLATRATPGVHEADAPGREVLLPNEIERYLASSLREVSARLQWGQSWLATVASAAPFLGLLGTVLGLQDALAFLPEADDASLSLLVTPLSQALRLTAWGLLVALPALLGYNLMGPQIGFLQQAIEDFADGVLDQERSWALV